MANRLTPEQSADVIKYYHDNANKDARERGWRDKVPLGRAAIWTTQTRHSILENETPLLTPKEMGLGMEHLDTLESKETPEPKDTPYDKEVARTVDVTGVSYDDARRMVDEKRFPDE